VRKRQRGKGRQVYFLKRHKGDTTHKQQQHL